MRSSQLEPHCEGAEMRKRDALVQLALGDDRAELCRQELLRGLGEVAPGALLAALALLLQASNSNVSSERCKRRGRRERRTHDGALLEHRGVAVEHEDGLDAVKEELEHPPERAHCERESRGQLAASSSAPAPPPPLRGPGEGQGVGRTH